MVNFNQLKLRRQKARKEAYLDAPATPGIGGADEQDNSLAAAPGHQHAPTDTQARQVMDGAAGTRTYTTMRGGFPMTHRSMVKYDRSTYMLYKKLTDTGLKEAAADWGNAYDAIGLLKQSIKTLVPKLDDNGTDLRKLCQQLDNAVSSFYSRLPDDNDEVQNYIEDLDSIQNLSDGIASLMNYNESQDESNLKEAKAKLSGMVDELTNTESDMQTHVLNEVQDQIEESYNSAKDEKTQSEWKVAYNGLSKLIDKITPLMSKLNDPDTDLHQLCLNIEDAYDPFFNKIDSFSDPVRYYLQGIDDSLSPSGNQAFHKLGVGISDLSMAAPTSNDANNRADSNYDKYSASAKEWLSNIVDGLNDMLNELSDKAAGKKSYRGINMSRRSMTKFNQSIYEAYQQLPDGDLKSKADDWLKTYNAIAKAYEAARPVISKVWSPSADLQDTFEKLDKIYSDLQHEIPGSSEIETNLPDFTPWMEDFGSGIDNLGMAAANPVRRSEENPYLSESQQDLSSVINDMASTLRTLQSKTLDQIQSDIHSELIKMEGQQGKSLNGSVRYTPAPVSDYNTIIDIDHLDTEMSMGAQDGSADDGLAPDSSAHFGRSFASIAANAAQRLRDRNKAETEVDADRNFEPVPTSGSDEVSLKELKDWVKDQIEHFGENLPVSEVADTDFENIMRGLQTQGDNNVLWTAYDSGMALIRFQDLLKEFKAKDFKAKSVNTIKAGDSVWEDQNGIRYDTGSIQYIWRIVQNADKSYKAIVKLNQNSSEIIVSVTDVPYTGSLKNDSEALAQAFRNGTGRIADLGSTASRDFDPQAMTDALSGLYNSTDTSGKAVRHMSTEEYRAARANLKPRQAISSGSSRTNGSKYEGQTPNASLIGGETFGPPNDLNPTIEPDYTKEEMDGNLDAPTYEDVDSDDSLKATLKQKVYKHLAQIL